MMNPNSTNQRWSLWQYRVYPAALKRPDYQAVRGNCARFGRLAFGSASEMRITAATDNGRLFWEITVRSEGHPVHDPMYAEWMHLNWTKFLREGFGESSEIRCHARLEAGTRDDGRPADQLIILPRLQVTKPVGDSRHGESSLPEVQTGTPEQGA